MNQQQIDQPETPGELMRRYPRITAHIIAESLGYAAPTTAARILHDAKHRQENWCEWIYSCYDRNALKGVQNAIRNRHHHKGYMAEFRLAKALVDPRPPNRRRTHFRKLVLRTERDSSSFTTRSKTKPKPGNVLAFLR